MGKFLFVAGLVCVSTLANAGGVGATTSDDWRHARPKIELQVQRTLAADTYAVKATISDLKSGKVLAEPKLIIHASGRTCAESVESASRDVEKWLSFRPVSSHR